MTEDARREISGMKALIDEMTASYGRSEFANAERIATAAARHLPPLARR